MYIFSTRGNYFAVPSITSLVKPSLHIIFLCHLIIIIINVFVGHLIWYKRTKAKRAVDEEESLRHHQHAKLLIFSRSTRVLKLISANYCGLLLVKVFGADYLNT